MCSGRHPFERVRPLLFSHAAAVGQRGDGQSILSDEVRTTFTQRQRDAVEDRYWARNAIADDEILSQHGHEGRNGGSFYRSAPRPDIDHGYLSLIRGSVTPEEALHIVMKWRAPPRLYGVRYVTAGALRAAGFTVSHSPNPANDRHVSASVPGGAEQWHHGHEMAFISAFVTHGEDVRRASS